jgi:ubiquinone/menaquinone biosynthesis C-methylase UbiE
MEENNTHKHHHYENETNASNNERVYNRGVDRLRSPERVARLEVDRVIDLCLEKNIKSVLDVGTGSALFAEAFHNHGIKVAGVDTNPEMIEAAKKHVSDGEFHLAPAEKIPFKDNEFDMTFFGVVFHEVDDYLKALKEAFRVSVLGTSLLEWDYKQEDFGPPIEHRLKAEFIKNLADEAGFIDFKVVKLNSLVLYKLLK